MRTRVTFRQGEPAPDMTKDEVITWLLGSTGVMRISSAMAASWLVTSAVNGLQEGRELVIETDNGLYSLTVSVSGGWFRKTRVYHAEEI